MAGQGPVLLVGHMYQYLILKHEIWPVGSQESHWMKFVATMPPDVRF